MLKDGVANDFIQPHVPALVLAPMEGVTDAPMRDFMTGQTGGASPFTYCVSEFLRVTQEVLSPKAIRNLLPEAGAGFKTPSGAPIQLQLLGGDPEKVAGTAAVAVSLGVEAIDLNFGCPAPTVNRHDGGAALLRFPDRIREIVAAVRGAVPRQIPVSAKLRLGWDSTDQIYKNAEQAALGGASWLTIHARTRMQGYAPPVDWMKIGEVRKSLEIPVIANGDIWTLDDFKKCRELTGARHFMIGRGALANPNLAHAIGNELGLVGAGQKRDLLAPFHWDGEWKDVFTSFAKCCQTIHDAHYASSTRDTGQYTLGRIKKWIRFIEMRQRFSETERIRHALKLEDVF